MEPYSWSPSAADFGSLSDEFLDRSGSQAKTRDGLSSGFCLVLDSERGELVEATVRVERKGVSAERSIAALKNHSEAERKRRARISAHFDTLRKLIPGTNKMDKASLLAEVISHLKELKVNAAEASEGLLMPMDVDETTVEKQEGLDGGPCLIRVSLCCDCNPGILSDIRRALDALDLLVVRAEIATFEGRMKNVFVITKCKEGCSEDSGINQVLATSIHQALRSILDKFSAPDEYSSKSTLSNKRRRISLFGPTMPLSLEEPW